MLVQFMKLKCPMQNTQKTQMIVLDITEISHSNYQKQYKNNNNNNNHKHMLILGEKYILYMIYLLPFITCLPAFSVYIGL